MKVLIAGNLVNMGFEIAKSLRNKDVDACLLMPKFPHLHEDPKSMYPSLEEDGYPEWVITFDNHNKSFSWNNWKFQVIREMRKNYDAMIALTEFSIFAMFSGKPYAALSTGSDMRELSFENSLKGLLYRLSYKKARFVIWGEPDKKPLLKKLGIEKKAIFATAPRNIDFKPSLSVKKNNLENKLIIFHPVAQNWRLKQNDVFLRAFVNYCSQRKDVHLIISNRGPDIENAIKILQKNANGCFELVPLLNSEKMHYYYNLADVIVDQFGVGSIGMITVEAMKCAKPVILRLNEELFKNCYETIPPGIINVTTEQSILSVLNELASNKERCKELGKKNIEWVENNWDNDKLTDRYIRICKAIKENNLALVGTANKIE